MPLDDQGEALIAELNLHPLNRSRLRELWHLDAPWERTAALEPLQIWSGRLVYQQALQQEARLYGFRRHQCLVDGFRLHWLDNGQLDDQARAVPGETRPVLLLLHGLSAEKSHWVRFARYFSRNYRVLMLDLPGHGQTGYQSGREYSTKVQAFRVLDWLDQLGIERFAVAGNSMGGFIAARIATLAPDRVKALMLVDAAGLQARTHSHLEEALRSGRNPFLLHSVAEFDRLMQMAAVHLPWMPGNVRVMLARQYFERRERWFDIFCQILREVYPVAWLEESVSELTMPVMLIWGEGDQLLDVDMLVHFSELLPEAQVLRLRKTGHMPMVERPGVMARAVRGFLGEIA